MANPVAFVDWNQNDVEELGYFDARDKADRVYGDCAVSEMYYPKGVDPEIGFFDRGNLNKTERRAEATCRDCNSLVGPRTQRCYKHENLYCMNCLKAKWFCSGPWPKDRPGKPSRWIDCPTEVLAVIATFISEYSDFTRFAATSSRCFEACNGDAWRESELTRVKRYTIAKEIAWQKARHADLVHSTVVAKGPPGEKKPVHPEFIHTIVGDFCRRLEVGNIIGEFVEPQTPEVRKRRLIGLMAASGYVAYHCGIRDGRLTLFPPAHCRFYTDDVDAGELIISHTAPGTPFKAIIRKAADGHLYEATIEDSGKERTLHFDASTGMLVPQEEDRRLRRCKGSCLVM